MPAAQTISVWVGPVNLKEIENTPSNESSATA